MMGRNVLDRQMFKYGGYVPMQEGGIASLPMQAAPMEPAPMEPSPEMIEEMEMQELQGAAMQQGVEPDVLEDTLSQHAESFARMDEAEDYETVINEIRGDQVPISERYEELASVVGQEDAQATPESVLTLVQPVIQMASVDQGIGGLAQEQMMDVPVDGPMAEGIMSTVDMGAEQEAAPPVNFNQGGPVPPVQYFEPGGVVPKIDLRTVPGYEEERESLAATERQAATQGKAAAKIKQTPTDEDYQSKLRERRQRITQFLSNPDSSDRPISDIDGISSYDSSKDPFSFERNLYDPALDEESLKEQQKLNKAQMLFAISKGFGNIASGRGSLATRLSQSLSGVSDVAFQQAAALKALKDSQAAARSKRKAEDLKHQRAMESKRLEIGSLEQRAKDQIASREKTARQQRILQKTISDEKIAAQKEIANVKAKDKGNKPSGKIVTLMHPITRETKSIPVRNKEHQNVVDYFVNQEGFVEIEKKSATEVTKDAPTVRKIEGNVGFYLDDENRYRKAKRSDDNTFLDTETGKEIPKASLILPSHGEVFIRAKESFKPTKVKETTAVSSAPPESNDALSETGKKETTAVSSAPPESNDALSERDKLIRRIFQSTSKVEKEIIENRGREITDAANDLFGGIGTPIMEKFQSLFSAFGLEKPGLQKYGSISDRKKAFASLINPISPYITQLIEKDRVAQELIRDMKNMLVKGDSTAFNTPNDFFEPVKRTLDMFLSKFSQNEQKINNKKKELNTGKYLEPKKRERIQKQIADLEEMNFDLILTIKPLAPIDNPNLIEREGRVNQKTTTKSEFEYLNNLRPKPE
jgi:hypothetical protein